MANISCVPFHFETRFTDSGEMITGNIDCLPDFLCKCVPLCFCIHHFFHNHFSFLLEPQQRVIPLVSVRTLFFKSDPKWALPVSQATYI